MYWRMDGTRVRLTGTESGAGRLRRMAMKLVNNTALVSLPEHARAPAVIVAIAFALMMVDGYDMFIMSFVAPLVAQDLHLAAGRVGELFAAGLFGSMVGGLALGPVADRIGRQPIVLASLAVAGASTFLCSRAQSFESFAALRFVTGFALGGLLAAVVPLVAEYFPAERRSGAVTTDVHRLSARRGRRRCHYGRADRQRLAQPLLGNRVAHAAGDAGGISFARDTAYAEPGGARSQRSR